MATGALTIDDFERSSFTHDGKRRDVFRRGSGPAVIVIAEMPGITPKVLAFAGRVADIGCTAVLPHLFGSPGRDPNTGSALNRTGYMLSSIVPACISREFATFASGKTSPVVSWLRALAAHEHERCGGPGVGAVGMCFTGGFALAMATDERFQFLREQLGDAFVAVELDDAAANPDAGFKPHSVLTEHLIDEPGQPTRDALDQVLDLFRTRLLPA